MKARCPNCNRLISVNKDGIFAKHRNGRSPRHCVAIHTGAYAGTHRTINRAIPYAPKPICGITRCQMRDEIRNTMQGRNDLSE